MQTLEIRCRTSLEAAKASTGDTPILIQMLEEKITLRELIARTVSEQIRIVIARRDERKAREAAEAENQLLVLRRQYLTEDDVSRRAAQGKVSIQKAATNEEQRLLADVDAEIKQALSAYERGVFVVLINGRQAENLDEKLTFEDQTRVTFLRLTPLVGG